MKLYELTLEEWKALDPFDDEDILTTLDNPYNPKEEFDKWYAWDTQNGYNTSEYLARLANYDVDKDNEEVMKLKNHRAMMEALVYNEDKYKIV